MGLLDKLFSAGAKVIEDAANGKLADSISNSEAVRNVRDSLRDLGSSESSGHMSSPEPAKSTSSVSYVKDGRAFGDKLEETAGSLGLSITDRNVSPDVIEEQAGKRIYARGGGRAEPQAIGWVLSDGSKSLYVRFFESYWTYDRAANRQVRMFCDVSGLAMMDFFGHLPNDLTYMEQRIGAAFGK